MSTDNAPTGKQQVPTDPVDYAADYEAMQEAERTHSITFTFTDEEWVEVEVCVEAELAEVIRERAVAEGVSEGDVVREAVLRYLDVLEGVDLPA